MTRRSALSLACLLALAGCAPATPGGGVPSAAPSVAASAAASAAPTAAPTAAPPGTTPPSAAPSATPSAAPSAAATAAPGGMPRLQVSFAGEVAPLLTRSCQGCHAAGQPGSGFVTIFDAAGAVRHDEVERMIDAIVAETAAGSMPRGGRPRLTDPEVELLRRWQADGAPRN